MQLQKVRFKHCRGGRLLFMYYRERALKIQAGDGDTVYVYRTWKQLYVLNVRKGLGYIGLETFPLYRTLPDCYMQGYWLPEESSVFFQGGQVNELQENLHKPVWDYSPVYLIKLLAEYIG